jgi:very-short-patch-repair endonuclease
MPGTMDTPPIVFKQIDGQYESRMNLKEAQEVVRILREEIPASKTVGVATFNLVQRNLILDLINKLRYEDAGFHEQMTALDQLGFFVKNLENIQGDERDIIIISTTFGVRKDGSFRMAFGPIGQKNGYRLLNVIITRARENIYMLTSIPKERQQEFRQQLENDKRVSGRTGLLAYLIYCKAVSEGNQESKSDLLKEIRNAIAGNNERIQLDEEEAPFEQQIARLISNRFGSDAVSMKQLCGGFVIDVQFIHPETGKRFAIATDGSAYHSQTLFWHNDAYRQEQLEKEGYTFIRLWSAAWWQNREAEQQKLLEILSNG